MKKEIKNVLITNSSSFTIGDVAIADCMIDHIYSVLPDAKIIIESGNAIEHKKYLRDQNVETVQRLFDTRDIIFSRSYLSLEFLKNNFKIIFRYIFDAIDFLLFAIFRFSLSKRPVFEAIKSADLVVSAGGDALTKHYGFFIRLYSFTILKLMRKKIVIYASTIGPFDGISKYFVLKSLSKIDLIMVRDNKSFRFLVDNGLSTNNVKRVADSVIVLEQKITEKTKSIVKKFKLDNKTIGIALKTNAFSSVDNDSYKKYLEEVQKLIYSLEKNNYKVIFFAANHTDYKTTKDFFEEYSVDNIPLINMLDFYSHDIKEILSHIGLLVSSRMHPIILASTAYVPVIGVSDESKMPEYLDIIGIKNMHINQTDFTEKKAMRLIVDNINNDDFLSKLKTEVDSAKKLSWKNRDYLKEFIKQNNYITQ